MLRTTYPVIREFFEGFFPQSYAKETHGGGLGAQATRNASGGNNGGTWHPATYAT